MLAECGFTHNAYTKKKEPKRKQVDNERTNQKKRKRKEKKEKNPVKYPTLPTCTPPSSLTPHPYVNTLTLHSRHTPTPNHHQTANVTTKKNKRVSAKQKKHYNIKPRQMRVPIAVAALVAVASLAAVCTASEAAADTPPLLGEDWHYPPEEAAEAGKLSAPIVVRVEAGGAVVLMVKGKPLSTKVGSVVEGWVVTAVLMLPGQLLEAVVLEYTYDRWGAIVVASPGVGVTKTFRKGVGLTRAIERPLYNLTGWRENYFEEAMTAPGDLLKELLVNNSEGAEAQFDVAASLLTPVREYAVVAAAGSSTKFQMNQAGFVKVANFTTWVPELGKGEVDKVGVTVFDPRQHTTQWPKPITNEQAETETIFSDYKTSRIGGFLGAYQVGVYDKATDFGYQMSITPVPDSTDGACYVRFAEQVAASKGDGLVTEWTYFQVDAASKTTPLADGALFYQALLQHQEACDSLFRGGMTVTLGYGPEGARLTDMARALVVTVKGVWEGVEPGYGTGQDWGPTSKGRGALPLDSFALDNALVLWGNANPAATRLQFYLAHYVRGAKGWTDPFPGSTKGVPGTVDFKGWNQTCAWDGFADGVSDYGRLLDAYVQTATTLGMDEGVQFVDSTYPRLKLLAEYVLSLREKNATASGVAKGLVAGPGGHDTCTKVLPFFSLNFWFWRGLLRLGRFLTDAGKPKPKPSPDPSSTRFYHPGTDLDEAFGHKLLAAATSWEADLQAAVDASTVRLPDGTLFLPPWAEADTTPFASMATGPVAPHANARYYGDLLSAGFLNATAAADLAAFREARQGSVCGVARFGARLDAVPAAAYAESALACGRVESFQAMLAGHAANFNARGAFSTAQLVGVPGDGDRAASFRAYLDATEHTFKSGPDVAFFVPSATFLTAALRHALILTERDADVVHLLRGAPRRYYGGPLELVAAPTRYGELLVKTQGFNASAARMGFQFMMGLSGFGYVTHTETLVLTLKALDPTGKTEATGVHLLDPSYLIKVVSVTDGVVTLTVPSSHTGDVPFEVLVEFGSKPAVE